MPTHPPPITDGVLRPLPLRSNFRWAFVGNVVNSAAQWGMITALAKIGNAQLLGKFTLGLYIAAPITALTMMQLRMIQATDVHSEFRFSHYFSARLALSLAGFLLIACIAWLGGYPADTVWVIVLVGLAKSVESVSEIIRGLFQRFERMDRSGMSLMVKGSAALLGLAVTMWWTNNIIWATAAMGFVGLVVLILYDVPQAQGLLSAWRAAEGATDGATAGAADSFAPSYDIARIGALIRRAAPLACGAFLLTLQARIPGYILERFSGEASLGYFGAMVYTMVAGTLVVAALGQSVSPRLARCFVDDLPGFVRLVRKMLALMVGLGAVYLLGAYLMGRTALTLLYSSDYADYHSEFVIVALASAFEFVASFLGTALIATRVFKIQLISGTVTCLLVWIPGLMLIPRYGLGGAAWTLACMLFVKMLCHLAGLLWLIRRRRLAIAAGDHTEAHA